MDKVMVTILHAYIHTRITFKVIMHAVYTPPVVYVLGVVNLGKCWCR